MALHQHLITSRRLRDNGIGIADLTTRLTAGRDLTRAHPPHP